MIHRISIFLCGILIAGLAFAQDEGQPASVIQNLIDAADEGSVISVPAGIYNGAITLKENIVLVGAGDDKTIIDGQGASRVITFDKEAAVIGFTIRNGQFLAASGGSFIGLFECTLENYRTAGILFDGGAGVVANNIISGQDRTVGILNYAANSLVINNLIENNRIGFQWFHNLIPSVLQNLFSSNVVAISGPEDGQIVLEHNLFAGNGSIGYRGELPESNEVREVEPGEFVMERGLSVDSYLTLMDSTYESAVKDHPIIVYDLHNELGVFEAITLFPWASFQVTASAVETVIHDYDTYDWVNDRQLNAEFVRQADNRPSVKVHNPEIVEKMRERYVLENIYEHPGSYYVDENGNRIFKRMTNLAQIEVVIPKGYKYVSSKPEAVLHDNADRAYLSMQDIGVTHVEVVLEPIAAP